MHDYLASTSANLIYQERLAAAEHHRLVQRATAKGPQLRHGLQTSLYTRLHSIWQKIAVPAKTNQPVVQ